MRYPVRILISSGVESVFVQRHKLFYFSSANNEILAWGSNKNYNLGAGHEEGANTPHSIDFFRKEHISIEAVALGAYHSLFLDKKSILYAVGHGKGGRLGNQLKALTFHKIKFAFFLIFQE